MDRTCFEEVNCAFERAPLKKLRYRHRQVVPAVVNNLKFASRYGYRTDICCADAFPQPFGSIGVGRIFSQVGIGPPPF